MTKIVINRRFGGYGLSKEAYRELGIPWDGNGFAFNNDRTNPRLVAVVEKLGPKVNASHASLKIVEIPDNVEWEIDSYGGQETVHEVHRSWS